MGAFLTTFILHWGIMVIFYKYNGIDKLQKLAAVTDIRFIYNMSQCEFCVEHHVGILPTLFIGYMFGFELDLLWYPFMSASLMNIVKTLRVR